MAGLYVHVPFCEKKCAYCDFYSIPGDSSDIDRYIESLQTEVRLAALRYSESRTPIQSIYLGGGTPSLLTPFQIGQLFKLIVSAFPVASDAEISMEVNPGTVTARDFVGYRKARINRVSLGVQSFSDKDLRMLCRIHTAEAALSSLKAAQDSGFREIGVDLIYGLPGQTVEDWRKVLQKTADLDIDHLSTYALTWSESTPLGRKIIGGQYPTPSDETVSEMYLLTDQILTGSGYEHYEISNYAKPGHRCSHNETYWSGEPYLGLGPSAHSYFNEKRIWNVSDIDEYHGVLCQNRLPIAGSENLTDDQQRLERIALGLRRRDGIPVAIVASQKSCIADLVRDGLAVREGDNLRLTPRGFLLADEIVLELSL